MARKVDEIVREMKQVIAEIATIVDYVNGSVSERPRKYNKADGMRSAGMSAPGISTGWRAAVRPAAAVREVDAL